MPFQELKKCADMCERGLFAALTGEDDDKSAGVLPACNTKINLLPVGVMETIINMASKGKVNKFAIKKAKKADKKAVIKMFMNAFRRSRCSFVLQTTATK